MPFVSRCTLELAVLLVMNKQRKKIIPSDVIIPHDNRGLLNVLLCVFNFKEKEDMILNKSLSLLSTSCLQITSLVHSSQVHSPANTSSVPVTELCPGLTWEGR